MKQCTCCKQLKEETEFNKCAKNKDGLQYKCRVCQKQLYYNNHEHYLDYDRQRTSTEERIKYKQQYDKKYYQENSEVRKEYGRMYSATVRRFKKYTKEEIEERRQKKREYYELNKDKINNLKRIDRASNPMRRLNENISGHIYYSIKSNKAYEHWENLVNFTFDELKEHLEKQFDENMTWDNYGTYWEIDHIIPVNTFNFITYTDSDFQICWSLANLRPLESIANRRRPKDGSDISQEIKDKILEGVVSYA